jgi:hypothetical protein
VNGSLRPRFVVVFAALVWLTGCASSQPPEAAVTAEMATAQSAVEQAEQSDAADHAALELRNARQKLEQAQAAMDSGDRTLALRLAEQAAVDAELAEAKSRSSRAQQAVDEVQASIRALREEIERNRGGSGQ